ncbi:hypothetical protein SAMN05660964_02489 [Thiothrix caldifontis]|jgi:hypothetical protein|uniref:N,N-dimethylformamidase beta subunit-like C-terminal domain-containing protein n=1 Tax=Thiothrix caldifontis TaxID=525918 RepID=A0A1H4E8Z3_9GAMM|nr:N,N-dimethylformamidase beta subunit family domain-containing protein [Thiothrix caldifontis]SEA80812.1 hypothetical protein SAMN05660964_02489 [Thiothrix caldifontis]
MIQRLSSHVRSTPCQSSTILVGIAGLFSLLVSSNAMAVSCDFKNGDNFTEICGYLEAGVVQTGGQMKVHVASTTSNFEVRLRRAGYSNPTLQTVPFSGAGNYNPTVGSYDGLNWGGAYSVGIPANWQSGIYELNLVNAQGGNYTDFFTIKSAQPGSHSKVLVLDSLPTKIAYSPIGGKSMYGFNSDGPAAPVVSMERPTGRGQWAEHVGFVSWLDKEGIAYEAASMMDLHRDPSLLHNYNLVILVGHNEYWSKEMRDNWDSYLAAGGNAANLSGNTMWWQVRFSADNKHMICYKNASNDPLKNDNSRVTVNWFNSPVNRPENLSTGVSFRHGGYADYQEGTSVYPNGGFTVTDASHWIFEGTGLGNSSVFGRDSGVVGYEVDGALFKMVNGKPVVTGEDGTPTNFQILATTPAFAINSPTGVPGVVPNNHNGQGWGTLGIFKPSANSGTVFVAPTIDWGEYIQNDQIVGRITKNVINRLKSRTTDAGTSTAVTLPTGSSGGGGSFPLASLLLGLMVAVGLKARKR